MKISTKGRYALRLMIDLAQHDAGGYIPLRDISKRQQISAKYLEQIVVQLSRAGFVISTRGAQGGYQLARHPSEYTVGDILRITEGSLAPVACLEHEPVDCVRAEECSRRISGAACMMRSTITLIRSRSRILSITERLIFPLT